MAGIRKVWCMFDAYPPRVLDVLKECCVYFIWMLQSICGCSNVAHVLQFGCCIFTEMFHVDFKCSMKHETYVVVEFSRHQRMANNEFLNIFDVANTDFECCEC
jgi:hypothetical protein